jgi:hypothetical protein
MNRKRGIAVFAAIFTAAVGTIVLQRSFAAAGLLYLSPATKAVQNGTQVTLDVKLDPGIATDGVDVSITYDQAKLQFDSIDTTGTAFPIEFVNSGGSGTVQLTRGIIGTTVSANGSLVAKVTFTALASSGSTAVNMTGNTTTSGSYNNPTVTGSSISFAGSALTDVYRLANWKSHERLFTTSLAEANYAVANYEGWVLEGIAYQAYPASGAGKSPIYRMANWKTHERLFTASLTEANFAVANYEGWVLEGIAFYGNDTASGSPVYRLSNWSSQERLFTISSQEANSVPGLYYGWVLDGVAFYVP